MNIQKDEAKIENLDGYGTDENELQEIDSDTTVTDIDELHREADKDIDIKTQL